MNQPLKELIFEKVEDSYTFKYDLKQFSTSPELIKLIAEFVNLNYTPKTNKI
ncbi:MAG TPA: hypothetical protein VN922_17040 [Bacteroidia bacterium]|nr:hypothetical protein [Bacteroidia bacterium]